MTQQAGQVDGDGDLRPDPAAAGQPATLQGPAGQFGERVGAALGAAAVILGAGGAGQRLQGGQQGLAGFGSSRPSMATMPGMVADTHSPRRACSRWARAWALSGSVTSWRWVMTFRSRGGATPPAAPPSTRPAP